MGQKINPVGFRLAVNRNWSSRWYANKKNFGPMLAEDIKVRDFLKVRGRDGKPCLVCGTTIRAVRVGDGDACFCPSCQPETRKLFIIWSASAHTGKSRPPSRR